MIKFYCDACGKEIDQDFILDGSIMESKEVINMSGKQMNTDKQMTKKQILVCKSCFKESLGKILPINL